MTRRQNQTLVALLPAISLLVVGAWWVLTGNASSQVATDAQHSSLATLTTSTTTSTPVTRAAGTFASPANDGQIRVDPLVIALSDDAAAGSEETALTSTTLTSTTSPSTTSPSTSSTTSSPTSSTTSPETSTTTKNTTTTTDTTTTTTTRPTTTTTTKPTTRPTTPPSGLCDVVILEAESLPINGAWRIANDGRASGGRYITWEGLSRERNNSKPADAMSTSIKIGKPGEYRFTWAMRQPDNVAGDKANDSWLNFPDADRFGPVDGGRYGGFIKVFGRSTGEFKYAGTADVSHQKSKVAILFNNSGTYTLQIAGRSHGHQIDRIIIHHDTISAKDAIDGKGKTC